MFRQIADRWLGMCYLAGPRTHGALVEEIAFQLRVIVLAAFTLGLMIGMIAISIIK